MNHDLAAWILPISQLGRGVHILLLQVEVRLRILSQLLVNLLVLLRLLIVVCVLELVKLVLVERLEHLSSRRLVDSTRFVSSQTTSVSLVVRWSRAMQLLTLS